jgi:predicted pyridoxine 5'-phosphate oxidase superfamily flavin-nucleotide-binding protein
LIFFVPGRRETLRVSGKAIIVRDLVLRKSMAVKGKVPHLAIVTSVERAFFHCGSCIVRSKLWTLTSSGHAVLDLIDSPAFATA